MLPHFDRYSNLPAGLHTCDWEEFTARFGGTPKRDSLLTGLHGALEALRDAGCRTVYVDGSFVTAKLEPGDFDACWDITGVDPARLDPVFLTFDDGRAAQKARFGGELFPAQLPEGVSGATFLQFFQMDRATGKRKGIVVLNLNALP